MSSSSKPVRSCRSRKTNLEIDLNSVPPSPSEFIRESERPSSAQEQQQQLPVRMIDLNDTDDVDDVVETSPRTFAQAKSNARRTRRRTIFDIDLEDRTMEADNDQNRSTRACPMQLIMNYDLYVNSEGCSSSASENAKLTPEPPKVPVFNCPICIAPLTEEMSTRCGHIFCRNCIKTAIAVQGKCPTCRKKITARGLIRVFLPAAS